MRVGQVVVLRGVAYKVTSILPDGEPGLTRLHDGGPIVRAPGGGMLGAW